jgi:hypothetical protein
MTDRDLAGLKEQYARQTARWNELRARFAAMPPREVCVPTQLLEDLTALGSGARRVRPLPKFGVRA